MRLWAEMYDQMVCSNEGCPLPVPSHRRLYCSDECKKSAQHKRWYENHPERREQMKKVMRARRTKEE